MIKHILLFFCLVTQVPGFLNKVIAQDIYLPAQTKDTTKEAGEEEFNKAVIKHRQEHDHLMQLKTLDTTGVFYNRSASFNASDSSIENIANALRSSYQDGTAVLFYNYEDTELKIWLLSRQGLKAYHSEEIEQEKLEEAINELRNALGIDLLQKNRAPHRRGVETGTKKPGKKINLPGAIAHLTKILLPSPIAAQLTSVKALIIVPVLTLGTVPFAILRPFQTNEFLIEKMSISVAPSLFEIRPERDREWSSTFSNPLIVGNPDFTAAAKTEWAIPSLPGAEKEAKAISKLVNASTIFIGKDATKTAVLTHVSNADFLYFATHGISDSKQSRTHSFLILSGSGDDTGFWTMEQILNGSYKAQLAVLSACQTGLGETYKGGVMALGRTFQVAGVPRVVMSLWNVDDNATVDLMEHFVRNLQTNYPAEALRQAMLAARLQYPDPSQWASFVLFGTPK